MGKNGSSSRAEPEFPDTEHWYTVADWSPPPHCPCLPTAPPGTEHLAVLRALPRVFLALYGGPLHNGNCFGCASLAFFSLSPSDFSRERERGAGQSRTHHSRRGNAIILASQTRGILVLYLKQSMSPGYIWVLFSVRLRVFSEVCPTYSESLCHSLSPCENRAVIFFPRLKSIGIGKDSDTSVEM